MSIDTSGFYTIDLRYAPTAVHGPGFSLLASEKDNYTYPIYGWTWYASRADAVAASLTVNESDPMAIEQQRLSLVIQDMLDNEARLRGFDNIFTACTYIDDINARFANDALLLKTWRSEVWTKSYEILASVVAGSISQPSDQELLAMLPSIDSIVIRQR